LGVVGCVAFAPASWRDGAGFSREEGTGWERFNNTRNRGYPWDDAGDAEEKREKRCEFRWLMISWDDQLFGLYRFQKSEWELSQIFGRGFAPGMHMQLGVNVLHVHANGFHAQ
jgi:hypothetical protein